MKSLRTEIMPELAQLASARFEPKHLSSRMCAFNHFTGLPSQRLEQKIFTWNLQKGGRWNPCSYHCSLLTQYKNDRKKMKKVSVHREQERRWLLVRDVKSFLEDRWWVDDLAEERNLRSCRRRCQWGRNQLELPKPRKSQELKVPGTWGERWDWK